MEIVCKKCGLVNDYRTELRQNQKTAWCNGCDSYIKNIPYQKPKMYFGKYKGLVIEQMTLPEHRNYFNWLLQTDIKLNERTKEAINKQLT